MQNIIFYIIKKTPILILLSLIGSVGGNQERDLTLLNESGGNLAIYWVHPSTREGVLIGQSDSGGNYINNFPIKSFVGHEFEIREVPSQETGNCTSADQVCHVNNFEVNEDFKQIVKVRPGVDLVITDEETEHRELSTDMAERCKADARRRMKQDGGSGEAIEELASCIEESIAQKFIVSNQEIAFEHKVRTDMAGFLENYTCVDNSVTSSPDLYSDNWHNPRDNTNRTVHVKLNRPASRVHVIENFIDEEECQAMEDEARATLHLATVADGKGGSRLSENRKAKQAGISVQWDKEAEGDPIARLSRRVYDYTEHVLELGITEDGQEDLMSIQYVGRGRNDTAPDRYTPHCDGDCTGLPHKSGTRMATMVLYCTLPTDGGSTNFPHSFVHVKPSTGAAVFFSYMDPKTKMMDNGFTTHSGCPVFEGEKKIVTQWVRYGVDEENPWDSRNTLGIKLSDVEDQE